MSVRSDVLIIGAGGAGMMCAIHAGRRGRTVTLLDHAKDLGGKILISGGGRCNFTNLGASPEQYVSENPHFCKSALSRYAPEEFIRMVRAHHIPYHEKKLGQLFCDRSARDIVNLLVQECKKVHVRFETSCKITSVSRSSTAKKPSFTVETSLGAFESESLVIATGGLSIPKLGATGFGYEVARQFGHKVIATVPALDGFVFSDEQMVSFRELAGIAIDCEMTAGGHTFRENLLFTHSGLSGPASLQASLHWKKGETVRINLLPGRDALEWLKQKKREGTRTIVKNLLSEFFAARFAEKFASVYFPSTTPLCDLPDRDLEALADHLQAWQIKPYATVGYSKAEVTRGGVDTRELSSKTMESAKTPGLYFIGEVVDVTGWLGGYNFQWAWASGWAAGQVV